MVVDPHPYSEQVINQQLRVRTFYSSVHEDQLVWHRDHESRRLTVVESQDWKFQQDNCLPVPMKIGDCIQVPANTWHRIIKGAGNLKIQIFDF